MTNETMTNATTNATWNIADVEIVEGRHRLRRRFARLAGLWIVAFCAVVLASLVGFGVAEAAPVNRLNGVPGPAFSVFLASSLGASSGLVALLWRRLVRQRQR